MKKEIISRCELAEETQWTLNDGKIISAVYGYAVGCATGCHNEYNTCTRLSFMDEEGEELDSAGFESVQDSKEGEYDWEAWEAELMEKLRKIGWID